jgi:hypothetical protein
MASSRSEQRLFSWRMPTSHEMILPAALDFQLKEGITGLPTITTKDGTEIFYKDSGKRAAHRVQPWLAAFGGRLGRSDAVLPEPRPSCDRA